MAKEPASLYGWQEDIISSIEAHGEKKDSEQFQGVPEFTLNRALGVSVAYPRGSGHTFLANYIAGKYPSLLVYTTMDHYRAVTKAFPLHKGTETISIYEIFYAMFKPSTHQPSQELAELQKKFENKSVVVVDNGMQVSEDIRNFIYNCARGIVVVLGH